jgi:hypothetical protein
MKYAGYVDETTGLPIVYKSYPVSSVLGHDGPYAQKAAVAKQRVKGSGGKLCIIEEIDSSPSRSKSLASAETSSRVEAAQVSGDVQCRIALFIDGGGGCDSGIPLFDFLALASGQDGIVPPGQPSSTLRGIIKSPKMKSCNEKGNVHKSQLLNAPIPYDVTTFVSEVLGFDALDDCNWILTAKTNVETMPTVDLSPFLLSVSTRGSKTDCILPFPVDTRKTSITYNNKNCALDIRMPLLQSALNLDGGPDPGSRQYEIQYAFSDRKDKAIDGRACISDETPKRSEHNSNATKGEKFSSYFLDANIGDEDIDARQLPEDAFHSQDVLSQHMLRRQEDEREKRRSGGKNSHGRDGADTEYVNVDDFRPPTLTDTTPNDISMSCDLIMSLV